MKWEILQSLCRFNSSFYGTKEKNCGEVGKECKKENCPYIKTKLKLFVWTGFSPDYTDGLAFAIAEDTEEAMKLIEEDRDFEVYQWGKLKIYPLNQKIAKSVDGGG